MTKFINAPKLLNERKNKYELNKMHSLNGIPDINTGFLLQEILESIDDVVLLFNHDLKVIYANEATKYIFKKEAKEIIGHDVLDLIPENEGSRFTRIISELNSSSSHSVELRDKKVFIGLKADKIQAFYAEGKMAKLKSEMSYVLVIRDVTWKRALENELERALEHLRSYGDKVEARLEHPSIMDDFPVV